MDTSILGQISALRKMSLAELREQWLQLFDESTRSRNKQFLFRRLAWRLQELQRGGLSDLAHQRIDELAEAGFRRARTPRMAIPEVEPAPKRPPAKVHDLRMPVAGSVISKQYKGIELRVVVREDGFEYDGAMYASLTAIAKAVTGSKSINGKLFFGLSQRKR